MGIGRYYMNYFRYQRVAVPWLRKVTVLISAYFYDSVVCQKVWIIF